MSFSLTSILEIDDPSQCKFHAARSNGTDRPLDVFVRDRGEWLSWNMWRGTRDEFNRQIIVSFIDFFPERWSWLFGGMFEVKGRGGPQGHSYEIHELPNGQALIGRLKIRLELGRGRAFRLENLTDYISIIEILKEPYSGEAFSGYDNISLEFPVLETLVRNQRTDWKTALENMKGVYVIVDRKTGRKYVGSAYGDTGIWARWCTYVSTGHGNNAKLIPLMINNTTEYAQRNFRITLLEAWPFRTEDNAIIMRESFWKDALLTRGDWGYNSN